MHRGPTTGLLHWTFPAMLLVGALAAATSGRDLTQSFSDLQAIAEPTRPTILVWVQRAVSLLLLLAALEQILNHIALQRRTPSPTLLAAFIAFWVGTIGAPAVLGAHPAISHELLYAPAVGIAACLVGASERDRILHAARDALMVLMLAGLLAVAVRPTLVLDPSYDAGLLAGVPRFAGLTPHAVTQGSLAQGATLLLWAFPYRHRWTNSAAWALTLGVLLIAQSKAAEGRRVHQNHFIARTQRRQQVRQRVAREQFLGVGGHRPCRQYRQSGQIGHRDAGIRARASGQHAGQADATGDTQQPVLARVAQVGIDHQSALAQLGQQDREVGGEVASAFGAPRTHDSQRRVARVVFKPSQHQLAAQRTQVFDRGTLRLPGRHQFAGQRAIARQGHLTKLHRQRQPHVLGSEQAQLDAGLAIQLPRHKLSRVDAVGIGPRQPPHLDQERADGCWALPRQGQGRVRLHGLGLGQGGAVHRPAPPLKPRRRRGPESADRPG